MRAPKRHRQQRRVRAMPPPGVSLPALAEAVTYIPSADHKDHWLDGMQPSLRSDATPCPRSVTVEQAQSWLQQGIANGDVGAPWVDVDSYPHMVWAKINGTVFEARLSNRDQGWYHGYPIDETEWPSWM